MLQPPPPTVSSPCTKVCTLDTEGVCLGCGRALNEIANWSRMSADEQREVCRKAEQRRLHRATAVSP
ncbi:hypothetical protein HNQ60_000206 [Povalibacter uvarum]|uniref:DUF1289 domain-containing protein n=1 Tax=Povalibacter uvarum TaxID=732238 RepID=A0A841HG82_9GAMM|nr:DUF1289 domain-containing protein [Povalibacter uvarum]MBB6091360.1 hypothetical protein [Povalibacter uvarum]